MILNNLNFLGLSHYVGLSSSLSFANIIFPWHWMSTTTSVTKGLLGFLFLSPHQGCDVGSNKGDPLFSESPIASIQCFATDIHNCMYPILASDFYWNFLCCLILESPILVDVLGSWLVGVALEFLLDGKDCCCKHDDFFTAIN